MALDLEALNELRRQHQERINDKGQAYIESWPAADVADTERRCEEASAVWASEMQAAWPEIYDQLNGRPAQLQGCPCGYRYECAVHCGTGHQTGDCPPLTDARENHSGPVVKSIDDAEQWIGIHQRYAIQDAERLSRVEARLRKLERSWWRKVLRRY